MRITKIENCLDTFGGKATGLRTLYKDGFNIPYGFVMDSEFANALLLGDVTAKQVFEKNIGFIKSKKLVVRSSCDKEDGQNSSFAGVFKSVLNVDFNEKSVLSAIKQVLNSVDTTIQNAYTDDFVEMNIIIQEMVDARISGVCFTRVTKNSNLLILEYVKGLGDKLVSGHASPKRIIFKINNDKLGKDDIKIYEGDISDISPYLHEFERLLFYKEALDIEWCIDKKGKFYFLQKRPITCDINLELGDKNRKAIIVCRGKVKGRVSFIDNSTDESLNYSINNFKEGDILVSQYTDTLYLPAMKKASAIITEEGAILSHAAIIARELNKPCLIGFEGVKTLLHNEQIIELDLYNGVLNIDGKIIHIKNDNTLVQSHSYNFDYIIEKNLNNRIRLIENINGKIFMYVNSDENTLQLEKDLLILQNKYNCDVNIITGEKCAWYFEEKRFKHLLIYNIIKAKADSIVAEMDISSLKIFYEKITQFCSHIKSLEKQTYGINKLYLGELIISSYFILDLYLPYGKILHLFDMENYDTNNILSKLFQKKKLNRKDKFIKEIITLHNGLWDIWVEKGIRNYDFFDDRESLINQIVIENKTNKIDYIYKKMKMYEKKNVNLLNTLIEILM